MMILSILTFFFFLSMYDFFVVLDIFMICDWFDRNCNTNEECSRWKLKVSSSIWKFMSKIREFELHPGSGNISDKQNRWKIFRIRHTSRSADTKKKNIIFRQKRDFIVKIRTFLIFFRPSAYTNHNNVVYPEHCPSIWTQSFTCIYVICIQRIFEEKLFARFHLMWVITFLCAMLPVFG